MFNRFIAVLFFLFFFTCSSQAHDVFSGEAKVNIDKQNHMSIELYMAAVTADIFTQDMVNINNQLSPENLHNIRSHLTAKAKQFFTVTQNSQVITPDKVDIKIITDSDSVIFTLFYPESVIGTLGFRSDFIEQTNPEFKLTLTIFDAQHTQLGLFIHTFEHRYDEILFDGKSKQANNNGVFSSFLSLGIHHILLGFDHLIFLLALLIICRTWKSAAIIITCFTLAHTVTLSLASLQIVSMPQDWVEVAIALTIIYVGLENLYFKHKPQHRWLLTSCFGLIHGFGFANVLLGIGLGSTGAPIFIPLFAFNLGVEIGQLGLSVMVLPLMWYMLKFKWYQQKVLPAISIITVLLGGIWAFERLI
jgi:hydrogenase/urease accessory protein HupE